MFGLDFGKMLSGDTGGGNGMIMNMIMKQIAAPGTQKMIAGKIDEMFAHLAGGVKCDKSELALLLKLEMVPVSDEKGVLLLEEGKDGGVAVQKLEQKAIIYVMVGNKAVQKIAIDQFLAMMQEQGG